MSHNYDYDDVIREICLRPTNILYQRWTDRRKIRAVHHNRCRPPIGRRIYATIKKPSSRYLHYRFVNFIFAVIKVKSSSKVEYDRVYTRHWHHRLHSGNATDTNKTVHENDRSIARARHSLEWANNDWSDRRWSAQPRLLSRKSETRTNCSVRRAYKCPTGSGRTPVPMIPFRVTTSLTTTHEFQQE